MPFVWDPWPDVDVHVEWGERGAGEAADRGDDVVVVDLLRFSTTVTLAAERGARVVALGRGETPPDGTGDALTLRPASVTALRPGTSYTLSSFNGAAVVAACRHAPRVTIGCLRNRSAVAAAITPDRRTTIVPCAERWSSIGAGHGIRPSIEDWLGAGAIVAATTNLRLSSEAKAAAAMFTAAGDALEQWLRQSVSGRELVAKNLADDIDPVFAIDATDTVPRLGSDGCFVAP